MGSAVVSVVGSTVVGSEDIDVETGSVAVTGVVVVAGVVAIVSAVSGGEVVVVVAVVVVTSVIPDSYSADTKVSCDS